LPEAAAEHLRILIVGVSVIAVIVVFFISSLVAGNQRLRKKHIALRKSEAKYRSLFERSKESIVIFRPDGSILDINDAGMELFGFECKETLSHCNIKQVYPSDVDFDSLVITLMEKGFVKDRELVLRGRDGRMLTVIESCNAVFDDQGQIVTCESIYHDLTQWKRLEEELFNAQKLESIATLAGGVAHDFNNILAVILMNAQFGIEDSKSAVQLQNRFQEIKKAAGYASELTQKLLTFSRRQEFEPELVQLNDMIAENEDVLASLLGETIRLDLDLGSRLPYMLATPVQVHQVLMNLVTNAHDAMPDGGVVRIATRCVAKDDIPFETSPKADSRHYVLLTVSDTGVGMDDTTVSRMFEPFFTTKEVGKGTGLGLAVVHGIMERHRGHVRVVSEPEKGTTFMLYFPASDKTPAAVLPSVMHTSKQPQRHLTVLLAEDYERLLKANEQILGNMGYSVIAAANGLEAVRAFEACHGNIDLAVLDVVMPELGGVEAYQKMQERTPRLPVLFLTGYDAGRTLTNLKRLNQEHIVVLNKPYYLEEFVETVEKLSRLVARSTA